MSIKYKDDEGVTHNINEVTSNISNEFNPESENAMSGVAVAQWLPFKLGKTEDGKYGYYKDGADTVTPFKTGSEETKWTRPAEWPNLDALPLEGEVVYYTIDNANRDATIKIDVTTSTKGSVSADIGYLDSNNDFVILDTTVLTTNNFTPAWGYFSTIDVDYPIIRLTTTRNILSAVISAPQLAGGTASTRTLSNMLEAYLSLPNATSLSYLVDYQTQHIKLANITSACKTMANGFWFGRDLQLVELENCDTSNITSYASLFQSCLNIKNTDILSLFDFSNCTTVASMFNGCMGLEKADLTLMNNTSKIKLWNNIFTTCRNIKTINMHNVDTSAAINMTAIFQNLDKVVTIDMGGCDVSNVTTYSSFSTSCKVINFILPDNLNFDFNLVGAASRRELLLTLNRLPTVTEQRTVTIGTVLLKMLSTEDITLINDKGWTLA